MSKKVYFLLLLTPLSAFAGPSVGPNEQLRQLENAYNQTKIQMNRIYQQMRQSMPVAEVQGFDAVQRKWIDYRDANCRYYGRNVTGQIECLTNMNAHRAKEMQEILNNYR